MWYDKNNFYSILNLKKPKKSNFALFKTYSFFKTKNIE